MKQDGVTINSGLERISARLNVDYQMAKWMNIGAKIQFSKVNQDTYSEGGHRILLQFTVRVMEPHRLTLYGMKTAPGTVH